MLKNNVKSVKEHVKGCEWEGGEAEPVVFKIFEHYFVSEWHLCYLWADVKIFKPNLSNIGPVYGILPLRVTHDSAASEWNTVRAHE